MEIKFNDTQQKTWNQLQIFLNRPGSGVFILRGYAGTGKTTLLQQLGLELKKKKEKFVMLAPTGRAATVLRAKTGLDAKTIHSELYTFSDVDGEPASTVQQPTADQYGQMRLMFAIRPADPENKKLFIVDEASMISDEPGDPTSYAHFGSGHLLSDLLHAAGTNKIIFSGDPSQLPPVGSLQSPALNEQWMKKQGKVCESAELSEILRQKAGSGILQLATHVRSQTQANQYEKWVKLKARSRNQVEISTHDDLIQRYIIHLEANGHEQTIAICHSNGNCNSINKIVRKHKYGNEIAELQVGDVLMVTQNNHRVPLTNGDFVTVSFIGQNRLHAGISFLHVRVKSQLTGHEHETFLCREPLYNGQPNLTNEQQRMLMIDFSMRMRSEGVKPKSDAYFIALQTDPYLNSLRANFGYAVTCHKSQGGEWDNVFLFLHKGMYVMPPASLCRWWYTGITRAREQLYLADGWWIN
jgi:ATP-dependent exoDNAse (exonuclease V) alpha subunit